ncbi:MAG: hypothetical protein KF774_20790 [Planctomyces sp.]|nr:hypothetical protein [Planctomyces sp.]
MSRTLFTALRLRTALRAICACVALVAAVPGRPALAQDKDVESIEQFLERKARWNELIGADFRVEGRLAVINPPQLRFKRCELEFRMAPELPALPRSTIVAEVRGGLALEDGKLYFKVTEAKARGNDLATLAAQRTRIDTSRAEDWHRLADWAASRGAFYQDPELVNKAAEFHELGLMTEYRKLRGDDRDGLLELAKRAGQFGAEDTVAWRFIHEACRLDFAKLRREARPDDSVLVNRILRMLPGANDPLKPEDAELRRTYLADPQTTYVAADAAVRKKLHRALYAQVLLARIERDAIPSGRNGDAIATRILQQLPELDDVAAEYRRREVDYLSSRVTQLTRDELTKLATRFQVQQRGDDGRRVQQEWLKAQEAARRAEGPRGLMELGDDYIAMLNDERTAAALYQEAYDKNPQAPEPADWFQSRDYVLTNGHWTPQSEAPVEPESRVDLAIREGRVLTGMTGREVRAALGNRPSSVVRQAAKGGVSELWIYRPQAMVVELTRTGSDADAKVKRTYSLAEQ